MASSIGVFGDLKPRHTLEIDAKSLKTSKTERKKTHEGASSLSAHSSSSLFSFRIAESTAFLYESAASPVGKIFPLQFNGNYDLRERENKHKS